MSDDTVVEVPDPIGSLNCPDCEQIFEFTQDGAQEYLTHWVGRHGSVYKTKGEPEISAKIKVTKEDGTTYEVPVQI